jgi:hypothetical protein
MERCCSMTKSAKKVLRKAGRPRGRVPRPHIPIEGDTLVPKAEVAKDIGVHTRTVTRMHPPTVYVGGVAYVAIGQLRRQIAAGLKQRRRR